MSSILQELYNGDLCPAEKIVSRAPAYKATTDKITQAMGMWRQRLSEDEYKQLEDLLHLRGQTGELEAAASFEYGFKLGAALMIEVLCER